jgi:hypothetical protein
VSQGILRRLWATPVRPAVIFGALNDRFALMMI